MKLTLQKPDSIGAIASTLCVVHCVVTPFLFVVSSCSVDGCASTPLWWSNIDYLFVIISFLSIYRSAQTTTSKVIKPLLWVNWSVLFTLILNEKIQVFHLPETITYITAFSLAALHIYNLQHCQCKNETSSGQNV